MGGAATLQPLVLGHLRTVHRYEDRDRDMIRDGDRDIIRDGDRDMISDRDTVFS